MAGPPNENSMTVDPLAGRLRRQDGVLAQEAQGQTVLLRLDDGGSYALEQVGALIWELCDGTRSLTEIVVELCSQFEEPEEVIAPDVIEFVDDLRRERLLVDAA